MTASQTNLKVCFVSASYPPTACGIGDYTGHLRRAATPLCGRPWLVSTEGVAADERTRTVGGWRRRGVVEALREIEDISPDLVHMQYPGKLYGHRPDSCLLPWLHRHRRPERPFLVTLHEFRIAHPLRKAAVLGLIAPATGVMFTSAYERDFLTRRVPGLRRRSCVVPLGGNIPVVPMPDCARVRRRFGLGPEDLVVCHFGMVQPNKGVEELLEAVSIAMRRVPNLHLLVIATLDPSESPYHAHIADACRREPLASRVRWTDYLPATEVSQVLQAADLCLQPYRDGVSGRRGTFMAAADHGMAILTTHGPTTDPDLPLQADRDVAFVEAPADTETLADALVRLAGSQDLRRRLRHHIAAAVADRTWPAIAQKTVECYERALSGMALGEGDAA